MRSGFFDLEEGDMRFFLFLMGVIWSMGVPYRSLMNMMSSTDFSRKLMNGQWGESGLRVESEVNSS